MSKVLSVKNLTKTFPLPKTKKRLTALDNLSFDVNKGEIFGLLGPNGAGKTTSMRIMSALIKSDSGDAFVDGDSVKESPAKVRKKIGFLSGDLRLEDFFTPVYLFDYFSALRDVPADLARLRREQLFERFGIDKYANKKLAELSSGMKQKVSFVVSITHDPPIIIFDEPTNGMDLVAAKTVVDFLLELKTCEKTIILSTHIFSLAEKICDRAGFIVNGKLLSYGSLDEITNANGGGSLESAFFSIYDKEAAS